MPVKAGPKDDNVGNLVFAYNMADLSQSYDGYPVQNFVPSTQYLERYNNPGFSGYRMNTGTTHPLTGTPIWELSFYPQNESMVPRLTSSEGFGCYHGMGTALYAGKIYMASIMIKEGPGTEIFNNYINHGYSNIGGWNTNSTTNTREYVGDGWWRFYSLWNNQTTSYSEDGVTPLATRYMSNYYTTYDLPAGESVVESVAMNFAAYVGNTPYRGTYGIYPSVQDDYDGVGVTIVDWGIDSAMTKPEYTPVFNYPDSNFSRTLWYKINMGAAGRCRIRTYTYGVSIYLTDAKYWKFTFRDTVLNQHKVAHLTAPMIHEVPSIAYKKPWIYVNGTRTGGLKNLVTQQVIDLANTSKLPVDTGFYFDGTNDFINLGNDSTLGFTSGYGTVEAIIKFESGWTAGSQYPNLVSKGATAGWDTNGWALFGFRDWPSAGNKSWGFGMRNGSTNRIVYIANRATNVYLHIVATIDGSMMRLYENGVEVATQTQTINPAENSTNVYIGRDAASNYFPGEIPYVRIYNKPLTAEEVQSNYNSIKSRYNIL